MEDLKLTREQAIRIRDDFSYLEGELVDSKGVETEIERIVIAPYGDPEFNIFIEKCTDDVDDEILAASLNPGAYRVLTLFYRDHPVGLYESLFDTLETLGIDIDLAKYGL